MLKRFAKIGLPGIALAAMLLIAAPTGAKAEVGFQVYVGPGYSYPVDPYAYPYYYPYAYQSPYPDYYYSNPYPYYYSYPAPAFVSPYYNRGHERQEWREHEGHERRGHEERGFRGREGHEGRE